MTQELRDNTGASATVHLDEARAISAYTVSLAGGPPVGRADFVDSPEVDAERIFFHTEVDQEFAGQGLAGLLLREALTDSIRKDLTVVPVCPLFAGHLKGMAPSSSPTAAGFVSRHMPISRWCAAPHTNKPTTQENSNHDRFHCSGH